MNMVEEMIAESAQKKERRGLSLQWLASAKEKNGDQE